MKLTQIDQHFQQNTPIHPKVLQISKHISNHRYHFNKQHKSTRKSAIVLNILIKFMALKLKIQETN